MLERHDFANQAKIEVRERRKHTWDRTHYSQSLWTLATSTRSTLPVAFHFVFRLTERYLDVAVHLVQQFILVPLIR